MDDYGRWHKSLAWLFFATLASYVALFGVTTYGRALFLGLCVATAALFHPEWGVTAVTTAGLLLVWTHKPVGRMLALAIAAIMCPVTMWLAKIYACHGWAPIQAALGTGEHDFEHYSAMLTSFWPLNSTYLPLLTLLGFVALLQNLAQRKFLLPTWVMLVAITTPRHCMTAITVPASMLCAQGIEAALLWIIDLLKSSRRPLMRWFYTFLSQKPRGVPFYVLLATASLIICMYVFGFSYNRTLRQTSLNQESMRILEWIAANIPPGSEVLFLLSAGWEAAFLAEWSPALTDRHSLMLAQGLEWLNDGNEYRKQIREFRQMEAILGSNPDEFWSYIEHYYSDTRSLIPCELGLCGSRNGRCCLST